MCRCYICYICQVVGGIVGVHMAEAGVIFLDVDPRSLAFQTFFSLVVAVLVLLPVPHLSPSLLLAPYSFPPSTITTTSSRSEIRCTACDISSPHARNSGGPCCAACHCESVQPAGRHGGVSVRCANGCRVRDASSGVARRRALMVSVLSLVVGL